MYVSIGPRILKNTYIACHERTFLSVRQAEVKKKRKKKMQVVICLSEWIKKENLNRGKRYADRNLILIVTKGHLVCHFQRDQTLIFPLFKFDLLQTYYTLTNGPRICTC